MRTSYMHLGLIATTIAGAMTFAHLYWFAVFLGLAALGIWIDGAARGVIDAIKERKP